MSRVGEVARAFGVLGLTSFGGPTAHLGYFRGEFVARRKWLSDSAYSNLVALCQFLPGPASSQVGMALGYHRAGWRGLVMAWLMFTAPSSIALGVFAVALGLFDVDSSAGWLQGLLAAAVGVVAHAVMSMGKNLVNSVLTVAICVGAIAVLLLFPSPWTMVASIVVAALVAVFLARGKEATETQDMVRGPSKSVAVVALVGFALLVVAAMLVALTPGVWPWVVERTAGYIYAGALVFGGGHVVLPLMQSQLVPQAMDAETFLSGYAAAQAVPGPLFTFATFTGAVEAGLWGALLATVAIFLPAGLLTLAGLHFFASWQGNRHFRAALVGVNAAVVGILAATLYDPVFTHGVLQSPKPWVAMAIAVAVWLGLWRFNARPWMVAVGSAVLGLLLL